jgi:predicted  nucleic acid-binding Zn-ribbon protein
MTEGVDCARCDTTNDVPGEFIGRYFTCPHCGCHYYVRVPNRDEKPRSTILERHVAREQVTLDDLLRDNQERQGAILRALRNQQKETQALVGALTLARWLLAAFVAVSAVELAILVGLLFSR